MFGIFNSIWDNVSLNFLDKLTPSLLICIVIRFLDLILTIVFDWGMDLESCLLCRKELVEEMLVPCNLVFIVRWVRMLVSKLVNGVLLLVDVMQMQLDVHTLFSLFVVFNLLFFFVLKNDLSKHPCSFSHFLLQSISKKHMLPISCLFHGFQRYTVNYLILT